MKGSKITKTKNSLQPLLFTNRLNLNLKSEIVYHCHSSGCYILGICVDEESGLSLARPMWVDENDTVKVAIDGPNG